MRKMKKAAASVLAAAMATSMMVGCSSSSSTSSTTAAGTTAAGATTTAASGDTTAADKTTATPAADEGKVLNIYCWNNEFATRMFLYPGYEANNKDDALAGGKIGDVTVNFISVANKDNAYQNALDAALADNAKVDADKKVDLFLVEADYALKYVDTDYTLDVYSVGLSKDDTKDQYEYTQKIMTDSKGVLKGVSWQACPGIMFYNRDIAKEVLGTDDPAEVQAYVKDWDTFNDTAKKMVDAGYLMESSVNDSFRVYSNNVSKPWVVDDKIVIDDNLKTWAESSKALYDMEATKNEELWTGYANCKYGGCFATFGPAWLINFCMDADQEGSVANAGKWGACVGPQSFYWGGTWMCAAAGTDNSSLVASIMKTMTCDVDVMKKIVTEYDDFVNNKTAMEAMAADTSYSSKVLGGMNPLSLYAEGAAKISLDNLTSYDQGCNEEFQTAMNNYFAGEMTYDEAVDAFYEAILVKYPNLSK